MKQRKPAKTWQKTGLQNLVRHHSGGYYARAYANGKEVWKSLRTNRFSVAQAKVGNFLKQHRAKRETAAAVASGKMTVADAHKIHLARLEADVEAHRVKTSTLHYWRQIFVALFKSWPELQGQDVRRVTAAQCEQWGSTVHSR